MFEPHQPPHINQQLSPAPQQRGFFVCGLNGQLQTIYRQFTDSRRLAPHHFVQCNSKQRPVPFVMVKHFLSDEDMTVLSAITLPTERKIQDYRSTYNDVRDWQRREKSSDEKAKSTIDWDDVVFEVDLLKSQEINLDYILELIFDHNKKIKSKSDLVEEARRVIRASLGNRAKENLLVDFINKTDLDQIGDKASVIDTFFTFAQAEQLREAEELIHSEGLNAEAAKRYITASLKREFVSDNGTELNGVLPKMSPLNPEYLGKKQAVLQKISAFVEKFKGVGGEV